MSSLKHVTLALLALSLPVVANADSAASAPAAQSSTSSALEALKKKVKLSYQAWLSGPTAKSLSGNSDGNGTNLTLTHYVGTGYRITKALSINVTQPFQQKIDEQPASVVDPLTSLDPYMTLSHGSIAGSEKYGTSLSGYLRYYMPLSRATNKSANAFSANDAGNGAVRLLVTPSKSFMDGALSISGTTLVHYRLAKQSSQERAVAKGTGTRNDYYFLFNPSISYDISSKVGVYVEYATGTLTHNTGDGNWTKLNNADLGQYISPGINWQASKRLGVNPYVSWGPVFRGVKNTNIGVIATYTFL